MTKQKPLVSVIIPARNEEETITRVIKEAQKITSNTEVIVVCNSNSPRTALLAQRCRAKVVYMKLKLGHDVGRAVGAIYATGSILLFIDADFVIPAPILRKYCLDVWKGYDVVLNSYSGKQTATFIHPTSQAKRLLNCFLKRPDLIGSSMTTIPHALSRRAVDTIGYKELTVPPKALVKAILSNLKVKSAHYVNTAKYNKKRNIIVRRETSKLIIGDHAEAIAYLIAKLGERGGYSDFLRDREKIKEYVNAYDEKQQSNERKDTHSVSVIITAHNEEGTIGDIIVEAQKLNPREIIVIENGSTDHTLQICHEHGVRCITFPQKLGHDVGRAIGARLATGDIFLFIDGDIVISSKALLPFVKACSGDTDIALNNVTPFYEDSTMIDHISMAKAFLNQILLHSHLQYSSLTAVPHAMKRSAVEQIGYENLVVPPKAQAIAIVKGLTIQPVEGVNVFRLNRRKPYNMTQRNDVANMILGDHIEAIHWVQAQLGQRGYLKDSIRFRDIISTL